MTAPTREVVKREVVYETAAGEEMKLSMDMVRNYLVTGRADVVTNSEIIFFMAECKARKLNPFLREAYLIKYSERDPAAIVESIHHKRDRARDCDDCVGWKKGIIYETKDGEIVETDRTFLPTGATLRGGFFSATPKGWEEEFRHVVSLESAVKKKKDGSLTKFWQKGNQAMMIQKVAESQGLTALWGRDSAPAVIIEEIGEVEEIPAADLSIYEPAATESKPTKKRPPKKKKPAAPVEEKPVEAMPEPVVEPTAEQDAAFVDGLIEKTFENPPNMEGESIDIYAYIRDKYSPETIKKSWHFLDLTSWPTNIHDLSAIFDQCALIEREEGGRS